MSWPWMTLDDLARTLHDGGVRGAVRGGYDEFDVPVACRRCRAELFMGVYVYRMYDRETRTFFYACSDCLRKAGQLLEGTCRRDNKAA